MANIELLDKVIAQIKAEPKLWNQTVYAEETPCGTAFCVAGWTIALTAKSPIRRGRNSWEYYLANGTVGDFPEDAMARLGINGDQAEMLFDGSRTLAEIERIRDALAEDPEISEEALWEIVNAE